MDGKHKTTGCLWPGFFWGLEIFVCFYRPIFLKLLLVLADLSQKHVFSRFRADHETADFAGISKLKQMGKRHVSDTWFISKDFSHPDPAVQFTGVRT